MRSFLFAIALSIIIVSTGSVFSRKIETATSNISESNRTLHLHLENKDSEKAMSSLDAAENELNRYQVLFEATSDHEELLRIELQYAAIREFIKEEQFGDALAACSEIELLLSHLPGNFEVKAENIL
ncbi:MAG: DUF4363 family protein [Clostridia bacterium]|nr:DUF4363 family protein [Clostridia bacterium]